MNPFLSLLLLAALSFAAFIALVFFGIIRKNKNLIYGSIIVFFVFVGFAGWAGYTFLSKSYNKVAEMLRPRTGPEIYKALFGEPLVDCVKVIHYQDQVIPRMDYAIALEFQVCKKEFERLLSLQDYQMEKLATKGWSGEIPLGVDLSEWFQPKTLGDTILVFEHSSNDKQTIQTFWTSGDSSRVFCRSKAQ